MKTIQEIIKAMLLENTGIAMCDSGGDNGRMWQRNQGKDFENEDRVRLECYDNEVIDTVSTYHYLTEVLEVDEISTELNKLIDKKRIEIKDNYDLSLHWVGEVEDYLNKLSLECTIDFEIENMKGDIVNTYNGENNLSQVLQFQTFVVNDEAYCILQIHGGADVRGGYTKARIFKLEGYLTGQVDVYATIDSKEYENTYNGYSLTTENGGEVECNENSEASGWFSVMEETYFYMD